jgi:hypothetical protein
MKIIAIVFTALFLQAVCILSISCASTKSGEEGKIEGSWTWGTFTDAANKGSSRITLLEDYEEIGGKITTVRKISGEITSQYEYGYAGWYAFPDDPTMEELKKAKSFSFKVLGDGQTYFVMVSTSDITDACYHRVTFTTKKDQVMTVNVRMGSLQQPEDWGIKKRFNQDNATQIQWQTTNNGKPGTFNLKIWDLSLYK